MAIEAKRGCGYRKVGGLYLEGGVGGLPCGKLPLHLVPCPLCDHVQPFMRGLARIKPRAILHEDKVCPNEGNSNVMGRLICGRCPLDKAMSAEKAGLLWLGEKFYTPESFVEEAGRLGVSRRLPHFPTWVEPGVTWIFVGSKKLFKEPCVACAEARTVRERDGLQTASETEDAIKACEPCGGEGVILKPGVFYAFQAKRIVKIVADDTPEAERERLIKRGLELVIVPKDDPDHAAPKSKKAIEKELEG